MPSSRSCATSGWPTSWPRWSLPIGPCSSGLLRSCSRSPAPDPHPVAALRHMSMTRTAKGRRSLVRAVLNTTFRSLRVRNYRIFATGQLVKLVGVWMMFTAQDWLVLDLSGNSPGALGSVAALQFVPVLLLTLYSGRLADRYDKRHLLVVSNAAFAITGIVFAVLVASGAVRLWHVFLFAGLLGIANAIETPVRQAFVSELVEIPLLPNALALSAATFNCARISGPALAGIALAVFNTGPVFLIATVLAIAPVFTYLA